MQYIVLNILKFLLKQYYERDKIQDERFKNQGKQIK